MWVLILSVSAHVRSIVHLQLVSEMQNTTWMMKSCLATLHHLSLWWDCSDISKHQFMSCLQTLIKRWISVNKQNVLSCCLWIVNQFRYYIDKHFDFQSELIWLHLWQCFMLSLLTVCFTMKFVVFLCYLIGL